MTKAAEECVFAFAGGGGTGGKRERERRLTCYSELALQLCAWPSKSKFCKASGGNRKMTSKLEHHRRKHHRPCPHVAIKKEDLERRERSCSLSIHLESLPQGRPKPSFKCLLTD